MLERPTSPKLHHPINVHSYYVHTHAPGHPGSTLTRYEAPDSPRAECGPQFRAAHEGRRRGVFSTPMCPGCNGKRGRQSWRMTAGQLPSDQTERIDVALPDQPGSRSRRACVVLATLSRLGARAAYLSFTAWTGGLEFSDWNSINRCGFYMCVDSTCGSRCM